MPIWRRLFRQPVCLALALALAKAGRSMPARIAMIAITTSSSMRVNAHRAGIRLGRVTLKLTAIGGLQSAAIDEQGSGFCPFITSLIRVQRRHGSRTCSQERPEYLRFASIIG